MSVVNHNWRKLRITTSEKIIPEKPIKPDFVVQQIIPKTLRWNLKWNSCTQKKLMIVSKFLR